jgi:predicted O-methyltransferase YrrM
MADQDLTSALRLPTIDSEDVCNSGIPIRILEPESEMGNVSFGELILLNRLVAARQPNLIFELGTFDGRTTINLAANAPPGATVYTIDLPAASVARTRLALDEDDKLYIEKPVSGARFIGSEYAKKITQLYGDTGAFDFSPWCGKADFVFVDASHAAAYVRNDTEVALRLVGERDGMIVWHDYSDWAHGVVEVLHEYRDRHPRLHDLANIRGTALAFCELVMPPR